MIAKLSSNTVCKKKEKVWCKKGTIMSNFLKLRIICGGVKALQEMEDFSAA